MALYFVTVWQSTSVYTFFKYPSSWSDSIKRFKMAAIIRFVLDDNDKTGSCCTTVLVQNKIQIHQQKNGERHSFIYAIISMQNEPNPFLCHPSVPGSRKLAKCFLSHLFYSQFGIVKICQQPLF